VFLSVVILGRFTTETPAMALSHHDRHAATTYHHTPGLLTTTPRDVNIQCRHHGTFLAEHRSACQAGNTVRSTVPLSIVLVAMAISQHIETDTGPQVLW